MKITIHIGKSKSRHIEAIDEKNWHVIMICWSLHTVATYYTTTITLKSEEIWTKTKKSLANINFKPLNSIFAFFLISFPNKYPFLSHKFYIV